MGDICSAGAGRASSPWSNRGHNLEANIERNFHEGAALIPHVGSALIDQAWLGIDAHGHDEVPVLGYVAGIEGLVIATGFSSRLRDRARDRRGHRRIDHTGQSLNRYLRPRRWIASPLPPAPAPTATPDNPNP